MVQLFFHNHRKAEGDFSRGMIVGATVMSLNTVVALTPAPLKSPGIATFADQRKAHQTVLQGEHGRGRMS